MRRVATVLTVLVFLAPFPAAAQSFGRTKQDAEILNYQLSMEKLHKLVDVQRALNAAQAKNRRLFDGSDAEYQTAAKKNGGPLTATQKAAIIDRNPEAKRVFSSVGWSSHEWILTFEAMGNAYMAIEAENGTVEAGQPETPAEKANVGLLKKNDAEFQKIMEELNQLSDQLLQE
jgi:hypothetical protein